MDLSLQVDIPGLGKYKWCLDLPCGNGTGVIQKKQMALRFSG